jgi:hypothetical protein
MLGGLSHNHGGIAVFDWPDGLNSGPRLWFWRKFEEGSLFCARAKWLLQTWLDDPLPCLPRLPTSCPFRQPPKPHTTGRRKEKRQTEEEGIEFNAYQVSETTAKIQRFLFDTNLCKKVRWIGNINHAIMLIAYQGIP